MNASPNPFRPPIHVERVQELRKKEGTMYIPYQALTPRVDQSVNGERRTLFRKKCSEAQQIWSSLAVRPQAKISKTEY